jgi:predicted DsbA family dithiol-disulfide isomerase
MSKRQALIDVVVKAGLDRHLAEAVLNTGDGLEAIKEAEALARRFQVEGVPFFIVNGTVTLGGAQPPDAFLEAFRQVVAST